MTDFTMTADLAMPYEQALARVRSSLDEAGFGVLTEIDMRATMRSKLGLDVSPQVVLGACRPELAHRALAADPRLATVVPCNVVISAVDDVTCRVDVFDPLVMTSFTHEPKVAEVATEAHQRLSEMLDALTPSDEEREHAARA